MNRRTPFLVYQVATAILLGFVLSADTLAADRLQVYILAGQSNMQGHVNIATFASLKSDPKTAPLLANMRDTEGKPVPCQRVWISSIGCADGDTAEQTGRLPAGFGASKDHICPYPNTDYQNPLGRKGSPHSLPPTQCWPVCLERIRNRAPVGKRWKSG